MCSSDLNEPLATLGTGHSASVFWNIGNGWIADAFAAAHAADPTAELWINEYATDWVPGKHGAIHWDKYTKAGTPCPVAIVIGCDPLGYLISGIEVPFGLCEYNYIGAILGEPVSVVHGPVTGLPVPAASEIVIEGWIQPGDVRPEGPFGEFHGYYPGKAGSAPVVTVERISYRTDPIIVEIGRAHV